MKPPTKTPRTALRVLQALTKLKLATETVYNAEKTHILVYQDAARKTRAFHARVGLSPYLEVRLYNHVNAERAIQRLGMEWNVHPVWQEPIRTRLEVVHVPRVELQNTRIQSELNRSRHVMTVIRGQLQIREVTDSPTVNARLDGNLHIMPIITCA